MQVYLDYSATTPCRPEAQAAMTDLLTEQWGNPSSLHEWGQRAATVLEQSRMQVASLLHAPGDTIVFTSGGTEANNLAIFGVSHRYNQPQHMIISSVEHSAIAEPVKFLESQGWQVTRLPVDQQGRVNPLDLQAALRPQTILVSVIYGQSEVGTLQPISTLGSITQTHGALFHTDAVQVAGRLPLDLRSLPVDLLSLSSHKLYGPQGVGALYLRPGIQLAPLIFGGGQEMQLRSGTQALPAIAGFGLAAELAASELATEAQRLQGLQQRLLTQLRAIPGLNPTGDWHNRLPHHLSFTFANGVGTPISGKTIVRQMNLAGIGISAGAACASGKLTPSPVLKAMGYDDLTAQSGIRLTLGRATTLADIDWVAEVLRQVLDRLAPMVVLSGV
jgi:cysteine desulfurase